MQSRHARPRQGDHAAQARRRLRVCATAETTREAKQQQARQGIDDEELQIEGLRSDYCDDFVCTSSPAVEQTVRALARDLVRQKWTPGLFTRDVVYQVHQCPRMHASLCPFLQRQGLRTLFCAALLISAGCMAWPELCCMPSPGRAGKKEDC
jgi:hypothetical protein